MQQLSLPAAPQDRTALQAATREDGTRRQTLGAQHSDGRPVLGARQLSRSTDGPGSHEAAAEMVASGALNRQQQEALALVRRYPGLTAPELERATGVSHYVLSRRLFELLAPGLVRRDNAKVNPDLDRCTVTGYAAWRWWAK